MSVHFETLIHRLKTGTSNVELVYVPHDHWPFAEPQSIKVAANGTRAQSRLRISVLDSSFNPPTLAHRALASVTLPPHLGSEDYPSSADEVDFDARLLLLSVRNADKALKPTDATYVQRLEMMVLLAKDMMTKPTHESATSREATSVHEEQGNVAVAIIDEPTFVGKSRILQDFLSLQSTSDSGAFTPRQSESSLLPDAHAPRPQLTFVVGIDTLERILSPRYYSSEESMRDSLRQLLSPGGDDSHLVCARRITPGLLVPEHQREQTILRTAQEFLDPDRVTMIDIDETLQAYSSSEVRARIGSGTGDALWKNMVIGSVAEYVTKERLYVPYHGSAASKP